MKKTFIGIFILSLMILAFSSCQKNNSLVTTNKTENQLTPQQLQLKQKMQQAAQIIAKFSNDTAVQAEIHNLIAQNIYTDDYIKFKDLFHPGSNE